MADNNNPLSAILDNPEAMKKIAELAGEFSGNSSNPLSSSVPTASTPDPAAELMKKAVPFLSSVAQSGKNAADPDRQQLLTALKPFVSSSAAEQLDKAYRLLSMAQMARTAAAQFASRQED